MPTPRVSVVIPTWRRSTLLLRAVHSVLTQTVRTLECVVVIDGPDDPTREVLETVVDARLRKVELPQRAGASAARNAGVAVARADWIALLDDDDEWLPHKLERQLEAAERSTHRLPIVACATVCQTGRGRYVVPRVDPRPDVPLAQYLLQRRRLFSGDGILQTSTLLVARELLCRVPFDDRLSMFQDTDWLLRAVTVDGAGLEFVAEPLAVWHADDGRTRIAGSGSWRYSLDWASRTLAAGLITRDAFAAFVMTYVAAQASSARDWRAAWTLVGEAFRRGRPRALHLAIYAAMWGVPVRVRRTIRDWVIARR